MKNKKAGFEMSMTTLVVIVIAVVMLILGLVFVRQIFGVATDSVERIDDQLKNELINLFGGDGGKEVVVKLGAQQTAKIRQGTKSFGFIFAISPEDALQLDSCTYSIKESGGNCRNADEWFIYGMKNLKFDEISSNTAYALVKLNIPKTQSPCDQKFNINIKCKNWERSTYFSIEVLRKGFM